MTELTFLSEGKSPVGTPELGLPDWKSVSPVERANSYLPEQVRPLHRPSPLPGVTPELHLLRNEAEEPDERKHR
ncbi:hypothetical protein ABIA39_008201 [Nocardia sp. GAS34]